MIFSIFNFKSSVDQDKEVNDLAHFIKDKITFLNNQKVALGTITDDGIRNRREDEINTRILYLEDAVSEAKKKYEAGASSDAISELKNGIYNAELPAEDKDFR